MHLAAEIERVLRLLPGVLEVRVACGEQEVREIHILASAVRHPRQLVRDIESVLAAHVGIRVDRRVISVAQLRTDETEPPRVILDAVELKLRGDEAVVQVELSYGGSRYVGSASGPALGTQRPRSAAEATVLALQETVAGGVRLFLEDVSVIPLGEEKAVVVTVGVDDGRTVDTLVGSAYVRRDEADAAARAVLSAVNRRHPFLAQLTQACE